MQRQILRTYHVSEKIVQNWRARGEIPRGPRARHKMCRSLSPKAGHNKAGRSDFRNQRFEPDTAKMQKMRKAPLTLQKQGFEETPQSKSAENADAKTRKMRMTGFNVTGFR